MRGASGASDAGHQLIWFGVESFKRAYKCNIKLYAWCSRAQSKLVGF